MSLYKDFDHSHNGINSLLWCKMRAIHFICQQNPVKQTYSCVHKPTVLVCIYHHHKQPRLSKNLIMVHLDDLFNSLYTFSCCDSGRSLICFRYITKNSLWMQGSEFEAKVTKLVELGFGREAVVQALKFFDGNEEQAAGYLFGG